ncbi:diguanylate cyclase [Fulvimarina sp. MAC3]|uniref:diguanylate cyclase domain-containing protein n=1 Tax=Fulvimarina sp. MAC3 TaxID=3148887 RepID=UPI0031FC4E10
MDMISDVPIRVGLVDDDPLFLEQATNLIDLRPDMVGTRLQNAAELERAIRAGSLDCVVIDYNLGGDNGLNLHLALTKEHANVPPVILISGAGCEKTVVKAFRSGFADYVSKRQFSIDELCGSIRRVVTKARANALAVKQSASAAPAQDVDELTGLFHRAFMDNRLRELLADRRRRQFAVMGIRIAQFEEIRAEIGHVRAERVAHEFACTLKRVARSTDLVGHWDGQDFMVLLDAMPTPDSIALAVQRLENALCLSSRFDGILVEARPEIRVLTYPAEAATREALLEGIFPEKRIKEDDRSLEDDGRDETPADGASWRVGAAGRRPAPIVRSTEERRRERRRRIMKRGQIVHGTHHLTIMCNVRDQSGSGARLRLDSWVAVPSTLELRLLGSDFRKPAVLRWQKGLEIGIEFTETLG